MFILKFDCHNVLLLLQAKLGTRHRPQKVLIGKWGRGNGEAIKGAIIR